VQEKNCFFTLETILASAKVKITKINHFSLSNGFKNISNSTTEEK